MPCEPFSNLLHYQGITEGSVINLKLLGIKMNIANTIKTGMALTLAATVLQAAETHTPRVASATDHSITVASYYFGNYHPNDTRNAKI